MFTTVQQYEAALDALHRERAAAERDGRELPIEIEESYMATLDRLWWQMTPAEQSDYEDALERAS